MFKKFFSFIISMVLSTTFIFVTYADPGDCNREDTVNLKSIANEEVAVQYFSHKQLEQALKDDPIGGTIVTLSTGALNTIVSKINAGAPTWFMVAANVIINGAGLLIKGRIEENRKRLENWLKMSKKAGSCGVVVADYGDISLIKDPWCDMDCMSRINIKNAYVEPQPTSRRATCHFQGKNC